MHSNPRRDMTAAPSTGNRPRFCPTVLGLSKYPARLGGLLAAACALWPATGQAVPSFARQLNMACIACHTAYPELNAFGRQFKLGGYTLSAEQTNLPPLALMLTPSFTHTQAAQASGAAPGFGDNNNTVNTQTSLFYAGRLFGPYAKSLFGPDVTKFVNKIGVFFQATYDGVGKSWSWDNVEVRYASTASFSAHNVSYGVYANNNPTLQDPWNTIPAWSFPFTSSSLAPAPAAATLIEGGLSQQVIGVGAYALFDNTLYVDVAGYHTMGTHLQRSLGVDPSGEAQVGGLAPYWRIAWQKPAAGGMLEIGTFGLAADTYPDRDRSEGHDRHVDIGFDSQYQWSDAKCDVTATVAWISERQTWTASEALGATANTTDSLRDFRATLHCLCNKTYGVTAQYFAISGTADDLLYPDSASGSPNSNGEILQLEYLPFNKSGGPTFWPRSNVKLSLQYVAYNKFDGERQGAHGNNTVYAEAWIAF